jgi:hypothetical protein
MSGKKRTVGPCTVREKSSKYVILVEIMIRDFDDFYPWHIVYPIPWLFQ